MTKDELEAQRAAEALRKAAVLLVAKDLFVRDSIPDATESINSCF